MDDCFVNIYQIPLYSPASALKSESACKFVVKTIIITDYQ